MSALLPDSLLGYVAEGDTYYSYSEYYGDYTLYGARRVCMPSGEPVSGAGKTRSDLIALGAVSSEEMEGTIQLPGLLLPVEETGSPSPAPAPEEQPIPVPPPEPEVPQPKLYTVHIMKEKDGAIESFSFINVRMIEIHSEIGHCMLRC